MLPRLSVLTLLAEKKNVAVLLCKTPAFLIALLDTWDFPTHLTAAASLCIHVIHQENG